MRCFGTNPGARRLYPTLPVLIVAMVLTAGSSALAPQEGPPGSMLSQKHAEASSPTDEREVEAFLESYAGHQLEDKREENPCGSK